MFSIYRTRTLPMPIAPTESAEVTQDFLVPKWDPCAGRGMSDFS